LLVKFFLKGKLPYLTFVVRKKYQQDSVNKFFLSQSRRAFSIACAHVGLQTFILMQFFNTVDVASDDRNYAYQWSCPPDSVECETTIEINWYTPGMCLIIVLLYLLKDFIDGFLIIYEGITISDKRGILAGCVLVFVNFATTFISMRYNLAVCASNTDFYENAAILLFLNDLDEKLYSSLEDMFPSWVKRIDDQILHEAAHLEDKLHDKGVHLSVYINDEEDHEDSSNDDDEQPKRQKVETSGVTNDVLIRKLQDNVEKLQNELFHIKTDLLKDNDRLADRPNTSTDEDENHNLNYLARNTETGTQSVFPNKDMSPKGDNDNIRRRNPAYHKLKFNRNSPSTLNENVSSKGDDDNKTHDYTYHRIKHRTGSHHLQHPKFKETKMHSNVQPIITLDEDDEYLRIKHKGAFAYLASLSHGA